ncbi:MAG TPA: D-alanine--D-alanine ligase [Patescibacteria group bacterium]|nr:D-alanine--D-alanine ligase [Patescibacteria group bacterium]
MSDQIRVAILTGGISSEREIALQSAEGVRQALGLYDDVEMFDLPSQLDLFLEKRGEIDVAIPIFHGKGGEDGSIQGFLNTLNIPFLFSDTEAHAIALNKVITKELARSAGIHTAPFVVLEKKNRNEGTYKRPCVIKPIDGGSSIGITLAMDQESFEKGLDEAFAHGFTLLIEDSIPGDEYTVAVIEENDKPVALPVIAIKSKNAFFDFESKYNPHLVEEVCPAPIEDSLRERLQEMAIRIHQLIGARHLTRSDFIVDKEGVIWFLEINTIPGQTLNSLVPKAIRASGRKIEDVFTEWICDVLH